MFKIVVQDQCGCFRKNNLENNLAFESKDDALLKAIDMKNFMNHKFCKKHNFEIQEMLNNFVIKFYTEEAKDSCCGNGCCI